MRTLWNAIRAALALSLLTVTGSGAAQQGPTPTGHTLDATDANAWLDGLVPFALRSDDIAGAVVVIVKDGQVVTARGYGWADIAKRVPVDPDRTLFRVGSVTKLFTWTAVMQQVEVGKLDLDRDVNAYLDFRIPPYQGRPVTLRQLMTHTAGFELAAKDTITFNAPIALDTYLKRWVPERIYTPGTTPAYSNWGAALAGYIVQRVSGMPYDTYVEQRIFWPLGMSHSSVRQPLPPALAPFVATGYPRASASAQPFEIIGPVPAGAISATGADMAKFLIAHLDNGRVILTPQAAAMMHASPLDRVDPKSLIPPLNRAELGFLESNINGHEVIGHLGDTQNFHTLFELFPNDHVGIFASFNSAGREGISGIGTGARAGLFEAFADRYFPAPPITTRVEPVVARAHVRMMSGMWQNSGHAQSSFLALATLAGQTEVGISPDGSLSIPSLKDGSGAAQRWDEVAPFIWLSRGGHERLAAQVVDGKVVRWSTDSVAPAAVFDRVPASHSARWLLPALYASFIVLALTGLYCLVAWLIRRRYRAATTLCGRALHAARAVRIMSALDLVVLVGWMTLVAMMFSNVSLISARSDIWLRLLQISGAIVFVGAVGIAGWNAWLALRDERRWPRKLWGVLVLLATLTVLYVAAQFGLLAQGVNY